ncbi:TetR/AcrR family transcriptional regulator [Halobacillus sp. K22]|uniref:TetR/AcrR family transcriptional regulator n=1 Tax=Halobacillus sp. K22 TaxID=3457431 RepID=UPI003FCC734A
MGRKKALTRQDVLEVTGEVLQAEGLHGVHFKKIADLLEVGRSTLYEYFKNKDELLLAYMKSMMEEMNEKVDRIPSTDPPNHKLFQLLQIILEHAQIYQIDKMIQDLQSSDKNAAIYYKNELDADLMKTYDLMMNWISDAQEAGIWNKEADSGLIGDLIFHSILFPNRKRLGVDGLASQLFGMIEHGVAHKPGQ